MWRVVFLSVIQSSLLAGGQVFLKFALQKMQPFDWTRAFWYSLLLNWQFAKLCSLDVYCQALSPECGLSDDQSELCVGSSGSDTLLP